MKIKDLNTTVSALTESTTTALEYSPRGMGQMGDIFNIDGTKDATAFAKALGVPDGWKVPVKIGAGLYASFSSGDRLQFYTNKMDYVADDE